MTLHAAIPPAREDAVLTALRETIGAHTASSLYILKGGVSGALLFRFDDQRRSYVLRLEPERIALHDRERGFACLKAAADVGAAPPVWYANAVDGAVVMSFIQERPLADLPGGPPGLAAALGGLIAKVQSTPLFPSIGTYPEAISALLAALSLEANGALGDLQLHQAGLSRLATALANHPEPLVSAHNDPNPRNLLFDGRRLWLVDWELAFANDPLVDIAILTTEHTPSQDLEAALLQAAFGKAPDRRRLARLRAVRTLTWLFYGCVVLMSSKGAAPPGLEIKWPAFTNSGFRQAVATGHLASGSASTAFEFGRMALATFARDIASGPMEETLQILDA